MQLDVVAVGPLKDPPVLQAVVESLVTRPRRRLHPKISLGIAVVVGALDLVGVPHVAVVGLDAFARQEMAGKGVQEDLDVRPGVGGVGPLHPDEVALEDIDAELVTERGLARVFMRPECIPPLGDPLLLNAEVGPVDRHQTIVQLVVDETALEVYL